MTILLPSGADFGATPFPTDPAARPLPSSVNGLLTRVIERLYGEYGCCLPLSSVIEVVAGCVHDLQTPQVEALPELTERLARHRLAEIGHHPGA